MKRIFLLLAIIPTLFFFSCSDDDGNKNSIVGLWQEASFWSTTYNQWMISTSKEIYEFKNDHTYYEYLSEKRYKNKDVFKNGTYTFDGKYLTLDGGFKRKVTFSQDGNSFEWEGNYILRKYNGD